MSRIGKNPVATAARRHRHGQRPRSQSEGPKGELSLRVIEGIDVSRRQVRNVVCKPVETTGQGARMWAPAAHAREQPRSGCVEGLCAAVGNRGRRFPRGGAGQEPAAAARLQPRRGLSDSANGIDIKCEKPTLDFGVRHRQAEGRPGCG